ncbi:MAG: DUF63 family protein [Candidatus Aenigmarchaeota archaeon]|nr:DUF63 family protein [Candidatus Aenigmarchaeota archaeon]
MGVLEEYFLNPILANGWFNPVNTLVYSVILIIAVFIVFKLLFKMGIRIDRFFLFAILPFIFWGSSTRVLHDAAFAGRLSPALNAFYSYPLFPTPGSYLITFTLALAVLLISLGIWKAAKIPYWKTMLSVGSVLCLVNVILLPWISIIPLLIIGGLTAFCMLIFFGISRLTKKRSPLLSLQNQVILGAHFIDASATFASLSFFGYLEQHVLPRFIISLTGPASMFFLKILVVIPVLWVIDSYGGDRNFKNFLKIVVFILGAAPGLRDLIRLMVGV